MSFDAQAPNTEIGILRGYVEFYFLGANDLRLRHAFGEWENLLGGQTWSTFMDPAALPQSIGDMTVAGGLFRRPAQFRYTIPLLDCLSAAVAVEEPVSTDFVVLDPANDVRLERWPNFVANLRYAQPGCASIQIAALVRDIGFEDAGGIEHHRTGGGLSATANVTTWGNDNIRLGLVGGQGIGSFIFGAVTDQTAAGPDGGLFRTYDNIGTYASYQHFWSPRWSSNIAYGYALADAPPDLPATAARKTQNTWLNLIWAPRPNFGIGIEYHYAVREVRDGTSGDNHRVQFSIQFGP